MDKNLYIIAGCNGAGKTTASFTILPQVIECDEFINADEIARGLSPFKPESVAFEAGRIMLARFDELLARGVNFAFETTLSTRSYKPRIELARSSGYTVTLLFFWLESIALAKERVRSRVAEGGHNIDSDVIERRYNKGILNLFDLYLPVVDTAFIFDNSNGVHELIAQKFHEDQLGVLNSNSFAQLTAYYDNLRKAA